jgi:hypothetical protein
MGFSCKILADSLSPARHRLTTFEITFPRIILAEVNTHRQLSRNSASSRAIPVEKMIRMVLEDPYVPMSWGKNQKGMQAEVDLEPQEQEAATAVWLRARDAAVERAQTLLGIGVHKQLTNRLLEPFMWHTAIVSGTEWDNVWHLRDHKMAHPDFQRIAHMMHEAHDLNVPRPLNDNEWHLPLVSGYEEAEFSGDPSKEVEALEKWKKISTGRCARISYLTHDGRRDLLDDVRLHDGLLGNGHMSPLEHPARPMTEEELRVAKRVHFVLEDKATGKVSTRDFLPTDAPFQIPESYNILDCRETFFCGNYNGWMQYRKLIPYEYDSMAER